MLDAAAARRPSLGCLVEVRAGGDLLALLLFRYRPRLPPHPSLSLCEMSQVVWDAAEMAHRDGLRGCCIRSREEGRGLAHKADRVSFVGVGATATNTAWKTRQKCAFPVPNVMSSGLTPSSRQRRRQGVLQRLATSATLRQLWSSFGLFAAWGASEIHER
ncbi:hypothetical protein HPB47_017117 [Ixodes persulcatus]|uniref:Uncharacterized protein n=1 Tax=Ixodes persulcatus TaxID=34615 RepID=A0AC60QRK4_IXOPE|nr:hypothetical protein HPB47_017117 [Ixodes persulcatus]